MGDSIHRRVSILKDGVPRANGRYVLYWMQHSQRAEANAALERAATWANDLSLPLLVLFVLDASYREANARSYTFMLEGIADAFRAIARRGAQPALRRGSPPEIVAKAAREAAVVVCDRGYLRHLVAWRAAVAAATDCLVEMVEGDVVVPVEVASAKQETAARTFRPRVNRAIPRFTDLPAAVPLDVRAKGLDHPDDVPLDDVAALVESLGCDMSVAPAPGWTGGQTEARRRLARFVARDLGHYGEARADIVDRHVSTLSPYLHFGQISPLEIYHAVQDGGSDETAAAFLEEMVVRRELAVNYVHYCPDYDRWAGIPAWARATLADHQRDERAAVYSRADLEAGRTDDRYWNAAMKEMRVTGYLHNHLRMYWGKRILGWTRTPEEAFETTLYLNNRYFLCGRDANSYANVGWLFGLHDRGWPERPVYGKVRIMTPSGLERKFDIDAYVRWAEAL
jgi:deoxyribodipyrimidine photo-lyase